MEHTNLLQAISNKDTPFFISISIYHFYPKDRSVSFFYSLFFCTGQKGLPPVRDEVPFFCVYFRLK